MLCYAACNVQSAYIALNNVTANQTYCLSVSYDAHGKVTNVTEGNDEYKLRFNVRTETFKDENIMNSSVAFQNGKVDKSFGGFFLFGHNSYSPYTIRKDERDLFTNGLGAGATTFNSGYHEKGEWRNSILVDPSNYFDLKTFYHEPGHDMGLGHLGGGMAG